MSRIEKIQELVRAEEKAKVLFQELENRNYILGGISEKELNQSVYDLAFELFGIKKYWHKRIVRAGSNTLLPYRHNPENFTIRENDILFLDFGPVFDEWEADFGRTYVLGSDPKMLKIQQRKLKNNLEIAPLEATDIDKYLAKMSANEEQTNFSIRRILNTEQVKILTKDEYDLRVKRAGVSSRMQKEGASPLEIKKVLITVN